MLPRIDAIRQARTKLRVTQKKLASMAGVSTSMINQIESGRSQPSYATAKKIFDSLADLEGKSASHTAGDFCSTSVVQIGPDDTLHEAIGRMRRRSISQIPVFEKNAPVGVITEDGIVRHMDEEGSEDPKTARVAGAMDATPPIVDHSTPAGALVPLVRMTKCVLVSKKSKIIGIITATDTLKLME